jgi:hypothetical protein
LACGQTAREISRDTIVVCAWPSLGVDQNRQSRVVTAPKPGSFRPEPWMR